MAQRHSTRLSQPPERFAPYISHGNTSTSSNTKKSGSPSINLKAAGVQIVDRFDFGPDDGSEYDILANAVTVPPTIPPTSARIITPSTGVHFMLGGTLYPTLIDTGSNSSIIDYELAKALRLPITPVRGRVKLATSDVSVDRIGTTPAIDITALYFTTKVSIPPVQFKCNFEVLNLDTANYSFIIGTDLIKRALFPTEIPSELLQTPACASPTVAHLITCSENPDLPCQSPRPRLQVPSPKVKKRCRRKADSQRQ
jgi:hypothetical protein